MESLFNVNGLMFWSQREIELREQFARHFSREVLARLLLENAAWRCVQFEGPILTPRDLVNPNYTKDDIWVQEAGLPDNPSDLDRLPGIYRPGDLVLRPETTPSSYVYERHLLDTHSGVKPPFIVWQTGKSFRREQDQVTKNMRLKEFYQQEFQCIYTTDTKNDYQEAMLEPVKKMIGEMINLPTRLVESYRLPSYSLRTMDVEAWCIDSVSVDLETLEPFEMRNFPCGSSKAPSISYSSNGRWMEVCSISKRTDFPGKVTFQTKKGTVEKDLEVLEIAIGLDRCVYNFEQKEK